MALAPAASAMMNNMASASQAVYTSQVTLPSLQMLVLKARAGFLVLAAKMKVRRREPRHRRKIPKGVGD